MIFTQRPLYSIEAERFGPENASVSLCLQPPIVPDFRPSCCVGQLLRTQKTRHYRWLKLLQDQEDSRKRA